MDSVAFLVLGMASLLAIPVAGAQMEPTVKIRVADDPNLPNVRLMPETGVFVGRVEIRVACTPADLSPMVTTKVTLEGVDKPAYARLVILPSIVSINRAPQACAMPGAEQTAFTDVFVDVNRNAPAFEDGTYRIKAHVQKDTGTGLPPTEASNETIFTVKNDYVPLTSVNPTVLFIKAGQGEKVLFPVELANIGNGPTRVKVDIIPLGKARLDSINGGSELRLESRAGKGPQAIFKQTRVIQAETPKGDLYMNEIYVFQAKFTSAFDGAATGNLQTDETTITFSVQVQGTPAGTTPGTTFLTILLLGLGVALIRRARGKRR